VLLLLLLRPLKAADAAAFNADVGPFIVTAAAAGKSAPLAAGL
jgi:hypothetical protein